VPVPQVPSGLSDRSAVGTANVELVEVETYEVGLVMNEGSTVLAQVAIGVPADLYQLAFGSPRHSPTVTDVPYPSAAMVSRMNWVKLKTV